MRKTILRKRHHQRLSTAHQDFVRQPTHFINQNHKRNTQKTTKFTKTKNLKTYWIITIMKVYNAQSKKFTGH